MLFSTPTLPPELSERLGELEQLRRRLGDEVRTRSPWLGRLRREVRATSVESSTSIEGFSVPADEALALVDGEELSATESESRLAVSCYSRAMDHVGVMATDPVFRWSDRVIMDLHFDACHFQREGSPGHWRTGPISIPGSKDQVLYRAPDADQVPGLMAEVVEWLEGGDLDLHAVARAAMAHLHVVSIHPFRDGNGRVSRIVQSLTLAREGILSPEFGSIEEYLGKNTPAYYAALQGVQGGRYQPSRDASGWVAFCVDAHLNQARQRLAQVKAAGARWAILEELAKKHDWPDRLVIALEQSLIGGTGRATYSEEAGISDATASTDFRRLRDAGLVAQEGRGRNIRYRASDALRATVADGLGDSAAGSG